MKKKIVLTLLLVMCLTCWMYYSLFALDIADLVLNVGDSKIFAFDLVSKINITNRDIVKVIPVSANEIIINGMIQGKTLIYIWDRGGRHQIAVRVNRDLSGLKKQLDQLLGKNNIQLTFENETIFANGQLDTNEEIDKVGKLIRPYSSKYVSLISLKTGPQPVDESGRDWKKEIEALVANPDIKVEINQTSVILKGNAKTDAELKQVITVVKQLVGKEKEVIDLLSVSSKFFSRANHIKETINLPGVDVKIIYKGSIVDSTIKDEARKGMDIDFDAQDLKYNILLCGKVANEREKTDADTIAKAFNTDVVNIIELMEPVQVLIDTKVVEIAKSNTDDLNIDWGFVNVKAESDKITYDATPNTGIIRFMEDLRLYPRGDINLLGPEISSSVNPVKTGNFNRLDPIMVRIQALQGNGKAKLLSNPKLVAMTGKKSTLHIGGQVPVEVNGQNNVVTIEWKDYGIRLEVTPTVNSDRNITVEIMSEVSDLDYSNATKDGIPAIKTRSANTKVFVHDKDTIVLSGLLENKENYNESKIPILGDLPYVGKAFRKRQKRNSETELIVLLTPKVVDFSEREKVMAKTEAKIEIKPEETKAMVDKKKAPRGTFMKTIEERKDKIKDIFGNI